MEHCLIADIGGTNSRLFLYELSTDSMKSRKLVHEFRQSTHAITNIYQLLDKFFAEKAVVSRKPTHCALAIAGPIDNNCVSATANFKWDPVRGDDIANKYGLTSCQLLNDFEAVGYAFLTIDPKNLVRLQTPSSTARSEDAEDKCLIVGLGTGLGVVSVFGTRNKAAFKVMPSEGGHTGFAPVNDKEWDFMRFARKKLGIKDNQTFSQELCVGGIGIPLIFDFLYTNRNGENYPEKIDAVRVFNFLQEEDQATLREEFLTMYCDFLGRTLNHLCKLFLPTGGSMLIGGFINSLLTKFFDNKPAKLLQRLSLSFFADSDFASTFRNLEISIFPNPIDEFAREGTLNHIFHNNFSAFAVEAKQLKSLKEITRFPSNNNNSNNSLAAEPPKKIVPGSYESFPEKKLKPKAQEQRDYDPPKVQEKKVAFDVASTAFEDFYHSNILKASVLTLTGFLNHRAVKNKMLLGKIVGAGVEKFFRRNAARQTFRSYKLRLLDSEITLIVPLNIPRLFINDVVLLNDRDTLYHSKENGWYFQTLDNVLTDVSVKIFDMLCEKFIAKRALFDTEKIPARIKFEFAPSPLVPPKQDFDPENFVFVKNTGEIQTKIVFMKALDQKNTLYLRRNKETIEEYHEVLIKTGRFTFPAIIPKWTTVPVSAFYGFLYKDYLYEPGYVRKPFWVIDEYTIFDQFPDYDSHINESSNEPIDIEELKEKPFKFHKG